MKRLFAIFIIALFFPLTSFAQMKWVEGTHYNIISEQATDKPEIVEFFSFWCPSCYRFEPIVKQLKDRLDEDTSFTKVHVNFMRFTGPDVQDDATRAMAIARILKSEDELNQAIFNYIHQQRATISGLDDLKNIFVINGVDAERFDKLAKSFGINSMVNKNNKKIQEFRRNITGVPNFIINGKYQAKFTRDMSADDMIDLLLWLATQK